MTGVLERCNIRKFVSPFKGLRSVTWVLERCNVRKFLSPFKGLRSVVCLLRLNVCKFVSSFKGEYFISGNDNSCFYIRYAEYLNQFAQNTIMKLLLEDVLHISNPLVSTCPCKPRHRSWCRFVIDSSYSEPFIDINYWEIFTCKTQRQFFKVFDGLKHCILLMNHFCLYMVLMCKLGLVSHPPVLNNFRPFP